MCYSKQAHYTLCDHWHRSLTACWNQQQHEQCLMTTHPDVQYEGQCPGCSAQKVHLQTTLESLHLTVSSTDDACPISNMVRDRSHSCHDFGVPNLAAPEKTGELDGPKSPRELDGHQLIELPRNSSPPQSPSSLHPLSPTADSSCNTSCDSVDGGIILDETNEERPFGDCSPLKSGFVCVGGKLRGG